MHARMAGLALVILFALQLLFMNISRQGPARILPWMEGWRNVWALLVALALGALSVPLYRAARKTWRDFQEERAQRRQAMAEEAVGRARVREHPVTASSRFEEEQPPEGSPHAEAPLEGDAAEGDRSAADVWTDAEEEDRGDPGR